MVSDMCQTGRFADSKVDIFPFNVYLPTRSILMENIKSSQNNTLHTIIH